MEIQMNHQHTEAPCFLCEQPATFTEREYGKFRYYSCADKDCGDYEISDTARRKLAGAEQRKRTLRAEAKDCKEQGGYLAIWVDSDEVIRGHRNGNRY